MSLVEKKLKNAFYGVDVSGWPDQSDYKAYCREINPPGYMIKMALQLLTGSRLPPGGDKSEWEICLKFKDISWVISDWKRYAWNIFGPPNCAGHADELEKKLKAVAKILDGEVKTLSEEALRNDDISLHNQFHRIQGLYEFFLDKAKTELNNHPEFSGKDDNAIDILSNSLNAYFERSRNINNNLLSSVIFFFALTEVIFDSCFSLGDRKDKRFNEFRSLEWSERFKFFISPSESPSINEVFGRSLLIRTFYRNIPVHASPTYFFLLKGFGLVPSSYERLSDPHISHKLFFDETEQKYLIETMGSLLELLIGHENTKYGYMYADSGLPIHISMKAIDELMPYMENEDEFKEELIRRNELKDRIDNMEI